MLKKAALLKEPSLVLVLIDLDHFKAINDDYGHLAGDDILKEASGLISSNVRENDKVFRIGGEEFMILSSGQNLDQVTRMVERLVKTFADHSFSIDRDVTISAGIAGKEENDTAEGIYKRVDEALYRAKEEGRNRYIVAH